MPRPAVVADVDELVRLRAVMLASLRVDPGPTDAFWRRDAAQWVRQRLALPGEWTFRVVGPSGGHLRSCGAAWVIDHLPGPSIPDGRRAYIGFMCTEQDSRRQGHARRILDELVAWAADRQVTRVELHASTQGRPLYQSAGFVEDECPAMYKVISHPTGS